MDSLAHPRSVLLPVQGLSSARIGAPWRSVLMVVAGLTLARIAALFLTPLQLYPDEAQYWLWSRTLDWGYYSKPPMIAWAIWATTALGGNAEPWVRLSAPLFHAGAALAIFAAARRLYGPSAAFTACVLYLLMPGVALSSAVIATDAPLLFCLSLALMAYVELLRTDGARRIRIAAMLGAAIGLAFLSKYAALYFALGLGLHAAVSPSARSIWRPAALAAALGAFAIVLAPNLLWNAAHSFATIQHTASNADWSKEHGLDPRRLLAFLGGQFGVFGPIPFAVLVGGGVALAVRRRLAEEDALLLCLAAPALAIVTAQTLVSRANANWAAAAYVPGSIVVAAWLVRWRAQRWLLAAIGLQAVVAALFVVWVAAPATAEAMGVANSFKRAKGWAEMTDAVVARAEREPGLTAVAVNNRFLFNVMAYYGRDVWRDRRMPPLVMWLRTTGPQNQAEMDAPLTPARGAKVLGVAMEGVYADEMAADFARATGREIVSVRLDRKRKRKAELFVGEGFRPRPRDPVTGLPTPP